MFKKILKWTIYVGVVGLLIFGAVIRTKAKAEQEANQPQMRLENKSSASLGQGTGGNGWARDGEEINPRSGQGSGSTASSSASREELNLAAEEEHDWVSLDGVVVSLDAESLWIDTDEDENLEITGRAWRYILELGFELEVGDRVELEGFYEEGEFEVSYLVDLTSEDSLKIREDSGRPMWSGRAGH